MYRRYMDEILQIWRKTLFNQSVYHGMDASCGNTKSKNQISKKSITVVNKRNENNQNH